MLTLLLAADIALLGIDLAFGNSLGFFRLEKERSIATAYSGFKFLSIGWLAFFSARMLRAERRRWPLYVAGALFLGAAIDDLMEIHERVGFVLNLRLGFSGYDGESFNWIIYFSPIIAFGCIAVAFMIFDWKKESRRAGLWGWWGLCAIAASLALEVAGGRLLRTMWYPDFVRAEEVVELFASSFLLAGLWEVASHRFRALYASRIDT